MAKKSWLDVAKDVVVGAAANMVVPGGAVAYAVGKSIYDNMSDSDETDEESIPSNNDLAIQAYNNQDYEEALKHLEAAHSNDEIWQFHYYKMVGNCHYGMMLDYRKEYWEEAEKLGLSDDTDEDDPRWKKLLPLKTSYDEERSLAYDFLKESLTHKEDGDFIADKDNVAEVYWILTAVCTSNYEQRRYDMAAMAGDNIRKDAKAEYKELTKKILGYMDDDYESVKQIEAGDWSKFEPVSEEDKEFLYEASLGGMFSGMVDYHERQFIYIAKNVDALAGCYDDNIQWLFTIDALPKELQFPVGHPQPNSLYYAHPAKKGVYLPIEGADEELFNDKVRDFQRLAQCLGATEITFRSVKGHSLSESFSKEYDVEVGGGYKGFEGSVGYGNKRSGSSSQSAHGEREMVQRFNPNKAPYVPDDVAWLAVDPEWQSLVKKRLEGNMLHYSVRISSRKTMAVTDSRMDDVKVAFKAFVANAHVNYSQQMERSFQREEETEWEISVSFKPLEEFEQKEEYEQEEYKENNSKIEEVTSLENYFLRRKAAQIQHYALSIVNAEKNDKPDAKSLVQRIKKDTGVLIPTNLLDKETKQEAFDALPEILVEKVGDKVNWHNIITTLPRKDLDNKLNFEIYDWCYVEDIGNVLIGVVTSGNVKVGDKIEICTEDDDDDNDVEATVTFIEMFGKKLPEAQAGDSTGLGVDIDVMKLSSRISYAYIPEEWDDDDDEELTEAEQEYIDNIREFLDDDAEITPRERKMLDRIRQKLGISEERAKELEASLTKPQLTEDEQEYLDMFHEYAEKGEVTEKERRRLDKFAAAMGITPERVKEIEKM